MDASDESIGRRIARRVGMPELVEVLAGRLTPTELQSVLLEVSRRRAAELSPSDVLRRYESDRFVGPSAADPRRLDALERLAMSLLPTDFEPVDISPVCPLGSSSVLGGVSQDWVVSTTRNSEVVSDSTAVLALECARRRRTGPRGATAVKLCSGGRMLRAQALEDPAHVPHFRLLGLCTAARDTGSWRTEIESAAEHLDFYLRFLLVSHELDTRIDGVDVALTDLEESRMTPQLERELLEPLAASFPDVAFRLAPELEHRRGYYSTLCFRIAVSGVALVDGGFTDWTQRLLSDRKERLLTSGIGIELLWLAFGENEARSP